MMTSGGICLLSSGLDEDQTWQNDVKRDGSWDDKSRYREKGIINHKTTRYDNVKYVTRRDIVRHDTTRRDIVRHDITRHDIVRHDIIRRDAVRLTITRRDIVRPDATRLDTVKHDAKILQYDLRKFDMTNYNVAE